MFIQKVKLENFKSYKNAEVDLGEEGEITLINGLNGHGKTSISEAIQMVFGKISHPTPYIRNGKDQSRITLTINNNNLKLSDYPKVFWVKMEINRTKANNRLIALESPNTFKSVTIEQLSQIIDPDDPLIFLKQGTARHWALAKPRIRWEELQDVIGIRNLKDQYSAAMTKKKEYEKSLSIYFDDLRKEINELEKLRQERDDYLEKLRLQQELLDNEHAKCLNQIIIYSTEMFQKENELAINDENKERLLKEEKAVKDQLRYLSDQIENIKTEHEQTFQKIETIKASIQKIDQEMDGIRFDIRSYEKGLTEATSKIQNLPPIESLQNQINPIKFQIEQATGDKIRYLEKQKQLEEEIEDYKSGKFHVPTEVKAFENILLQEKIEFEFLYDVVDILPEMKEWAKALESALGYEKFAVIVTESEYYRTAKLARDNHFKGYILKENAEEYESNRDSNTLTFHDIVKIRSLRFTEHQIKQHLNNLIGRIGFIHDIEETKHLHDKRPYISQDCIQKNRIGLRYIGQNDYILGHNSRMETLSVKEKELDANKKDLTSVLCRLTHLEEEQLRISNQLRCWENYNNLLTPDQIQTQKNHNIKFKVLEGELNKLKKIQEDLEEELKDPIQKRQDYENRKATSTHELQEKQKLIEGMNNQHNEIVQKVDFLKHQIKEKAKILGTENELDDFSIDEKSSYFFISRYRVELNQFEIIIRALKLRLDDKKFEHLSQDCIKSCNEAETRVQSIENKYKEHEGYVKEWTDKIIAIETQIDTHEKLWITSVNTNFRKYLDILGMKGEVEISKLYEGQRELHIYVKPTPDRESFDVIENMVSGGQATQIAMAFTLAIQKVKERPFMILDEYDQELDADKQKILTRLFKEHCSGKLILISPRTYSEGYIRLFDRIIHTRWSDAQGSFAVSIKINPETGQDLGSFVITPEEVEKIDKK